MKPRSKAANTGNDDILPDTRSNNMCAAFKNIDVLEMH